MKKSVHAVVVMVFVFAVGYFLGSQHECPYPSVEYVQSRLNEVGANLDIDGIAGKKTIKVWMFPQHGLAGL